MKVKKIAMGFVYAMYILAAPLVSLIIGLIWFVCFIMDKEQSYNPNGSILPTIYDDKRIELNKTSYKL